MALNRFYYPYKYNTRRDFLSTNVICVFISYQQRDKEQAEKIADYIQNAGVDVYIDKYDAELKVHHQNKDPKKVTEAICRGINNSSHMLVIVSPNTVYSTWVPFEIGYGFDKTDLAVLCLKGIPKGGLPEYIRTAPVIRDFVDLNVKLGSLTARYKENLLEKGTSSEYSSINPVYEVMDTVMGDQY